MLFFAPAQIKKRADDGRGMQGVAEAWALFVARVADVDRPWLRVVATDGRDAVLATYQALLEGRVPGNEGRILASVSASAGRHALNRRAAMPICG